MAECFKCGISSEKSWLSDAIGPEGIVKICRKCSDEEDIPLIRRPSMEQIKTSVSEQPLRDRLALSAGIEVKKIPKEQQEFLSRQNTQLKDLVDRNFKLTVPKKPEKREDLISNFHWVIMRARRARKLSPSQLAQGIGEPEIAIKMAEQGNLGKEGDKLISKLESYFGIRLFKRDKRPSLVDDVGMVLPIREARDKLNEEGYFSEEKRKSLTFDRVLSKDVTLSDLKSMERDGKVLSSSITSSEIDDLEIDEDAKEMLRRERLHEEAYEERGDLSNKKNLSDEEMNDLIFGRG